MLEKPNGMKKYVHICELLVVLQILSSNRPGAHQPASAKDYTLRCGMLIVGPLDTQKDCMEPRGLMLTASEGHERTAALAIQMSQ